MLGFVYQLIPFLTAVYFPANSDYLFVSAVGKVHREPGANKSSQDLNEALSLVSSYEFLFRCMCFAGSHPDLSVSACCLAAAGRYTCSGSGSLHPQPLPGTAKSTLVCWWIIQALKVVDSGAVLNEVLPGGASYEQGEIVILCVRFQRACFGQLETSSL